MAGAETPERESPTRTQRWLDLLATLVGQRFPVPIDRIMDEVPGYRSRWRNGDERERLSVRRMFERDKEGLRRIGIPIESARLRDREGTLAGDPGFAEQEGYRIRPRDFYLPYLELLPKGTGQGSGGPDGLGHSIGTVALPEDDVATAVRALRAALTLPSFPFSREGRSALRKLTFDLDPALDSAAGVTDARVRLLDRPGGADPFGVLGTVLDGLHDRKRIGFRYRSIGREGEEEREVEPWGLLFQWGAWYLVAHDSSRRGVRLFRADRMSGAHQLRPSGSSSEFHVPDDFDVDAHVGRRPWELGEDEEEVQAVARFLPPTSHLAERNAWGEALPPDGGGGVLRRFRLRRTDPFLRWVLSFAGEVRVVGPPELVRDFRANAIRLAGLHGEEG